MSATTLHYHILRNMLKYKRKVMLLRIQIYNRMTLPAEDISQLQELLKNLSDKGSRDA